MQKHLIAILYGIQIFIIFILDLLTTHSISKYKITDIVEHNIYIGTINLLLNTKILLIIDCYFFSKFYLENNLNVIYQNIIIKLISILIWIIVSCRFKFTSFVIAFISFKIFSIFFLIRSLNYMEDLIYFKFNKKIGVDAILIFKYLLLEMIITLKYLAMIFECLSMFVSLSLEYGIGQKPFNITKLIIHLLDIYIRKQNITSKRYLLLTTPFYFLSFVYGLIIIGKYFINNTIQYNMIFVFNRFFNLFILIISLILIFKLNNN